MKKVYITSLEDCSHLIFFLDENYEVVGSLDEHDGEWVEEQFHPLMEELGIRFERIEADSVEGLLYRLQQLLEDWF